MGRLRGKSPRGALSTEDCLGRQAMRPSPREMPSPGRKSTQVPLEALRASRGLLRCNATPADAHGHHSGHRVMRLVRCGDICAADAKLMIKGGTQRCCTRPTDYETFLFGARGKAGATRQVDINSGTPPRAPATSRLTVLADGGFSAPTVVSTIMDQVHRQPNCGGLGRPSRAPTAPIKGGSPPL